MNATFPRLAARDLYGNDVTLPTDLPGELNVVIVAFRRAQQAQVDTWLPWLEQQANANPRLRYVELPTIGRHWAPARTAIDGGMASAIQDDATRRRTLTVYTDVRRVTIPLGIDDRTTIWLFLVDRDGHVMWRGAGAFEASTADALAAAIADAKSENGEGAEQFEFAFDDRYRPLLAALGVTPAAAHVTVGPDRLVACFGPWQVRTTPANVSDVSVSGPYQAHRAIGARLSFADRGMTLGSSVTAGVCLSFREPVRGLEPFGLLHHPGLTVTVAEPERFASTVRRFAKLPDIV